MKRGYGCCLTLIKEFRKGDKRVNFEANFRYFSTRQESGMMKSGSRGASSLARGLVNYCAHQEPYPEGAAWADGATREHYGLWSGLREPSLAEKWPEMTQIKLNIAITPH